MIYPQNCRQVRSLFETHFDSYIRTYEEQIEPQSGPLRPVVARSVEELLSCERLQGGFARREIRTGRTGKGVLQHQGKSLPNPALPVLISWSRFLVSLANFPKRALSLPYRNAYNLVPRISQLPNPLIGQSSIKRPKSPPKASEYRKRTDVFALGSAEWRRSCARCRPHSSPCDASHAAARNGCGCGGYSSAR